MTRTEGEHELVLGNKQLLSAFFVVVILLGVFFTMGYFVGKNTATAGLNAGQSPVGRHASRTRRASRSTMAVPRAVRPLAGEHATRRLVDPSVSAPSAAPSAGCFKPDLRSDAKVNEKSDFPLESAPSEVRFVQVSKPSPKRPRPETMVESTKANSCTCRFSAIRRPDADNLVKVLRERGFHALLGESSKQGLVIACWWDRPPQN